MRINKRVSNFGICSRKVINRLTKENRITLNGIYCNC